MAIFNRISQLFQADFHAVLDRIEEPELQLRQAIREMEDELTSDQQRYKMIAHDLKQLALSQQEINSSLSRIEDELDTCFNANNEDLARPLVKRKLEQQQAMRFVEQKISHQEHTKKSLDARITENKGHLENMRQKAELLSENLQRQSDSISYNPVEFSVDEADIEVALLREKEKRSHS